MNSSLKKIHLLKFFSLVIALLAITSFKAEAQTNGYPLNYKIEGKDTVYLIYMRELYFFNRPVNKNSRQWRNYYRLVYNFKKVYPYALIARDKIHQADSIIAARNYKGGQRERFIKQFENELFSEFEKPLKKMTISQGKLLLKLIDREVGQSSYYLIKNYRGGFTAFFWQGIARIFGSNLKTPYDKFGEDKAIEELVVMYQNGSFDCLYYSLF